MNYTIGECGTLPSKGQMYNVPFNPDIKVRSMTGNEEMKRLSPSENMYKNLCEIIDDCLVEKLPISSYDLCIGDYQYLLHKLRIVTYGADYQSTSRCPHCGRVNNDVINLNNLLVFTYSPELEKYRTFELPDSKKTVKLKIQTPRLLDKILTDTKEYKRRTNSQTDPLIAITVGNIIEEINGERPNPITIVEDVKAFSMRDINYLTQISDKLTESVGIENKLMHVCDFCTNYYESSMRADSEFFRPTILF